MDKSSFTETDVMEAKFNGYTDAFPPKDGSAIQLLKPDGKTTIIKFDQTAYGGKGGWFTDQNHAVRFPTNGLWKLYL